MNMLKLIIITVLSLITIHTNAIDITINDGYGTGTGWYSANKENNEVEINCETGQNWDMESFALTGTTLTMQGGYAFNTPAGYEGWKPGDIFFDIDSDGKYDYVASIASSWFTPYKLGTAYSVHYAQNTTSNPWKYKDGGTIVGQDQLINFSAFNDSEGNHNVMKIDIGWLFQYLTPGDIVTVHYTMECGNDNLMGKFSVPETGMSLSLLGLSIIGLFSIKNKIA